MNLENIDISFIENIESKYLKNKMKNMELNQDNIDLMEDLAKLEYWVKNGPGGWVAAMHYHSMKTKYEQEYKKLLQELNPKYYKELLDEEKIDEEEIKKENDKAAKRNIRKLKKLKKLKKVWEK